MTRDTRIRISLLALRMGVFAVFMVWTLDKLFNYQHNSGMISHYYHVDLPQWFLVALGLAELGMLFGFLLGLFKNFTYAAVLVAHAVTTLVSSWRLLPPYEIHQLLYFGSLPMLAACVALYLLRSEDTLWNLSKP
ncbi:DoxX family membrane protein [Congregibacter brevis]|uniref:DoxX family membrane protein n=1 Tax=Congregibacter brevis TaxID=3081201 RepID=A0ABZ0IGD2_9GAMM|nr:DoxX family membrane protein [Congregibacter sp. IMCC45268]